MPGTLPYITHLKEGVLRQYSDKEELARKSKVPIATIRRMAAGANFNIDNMLKITSAICKELAA